MKTDRRSHLRYLLILALLPVLPCTAEINSKQVFPSGNKELLNRSVKGTKIVLKNSRECHVSEIIKLRKKLGEIQASIQICLDELKSASLDAENWSQWERLLDISKSLIELKKYQQSLLSKSESISGVGMQLSFDNLTNLVVVQFVLPESPAAHAGLQVNDVIMSIDGKSTNASSINDLKEIVDQIRGWKGTPVTIRVRSGKREWNQTLIRRPINANTNSSETYSREYASLYKAYYMLNDIAGAQKMYPFLYQILSEKFGDRSEEVASLIADHSYLIFNSGNSSKAYNLVRKAIAIYEQNSDANTQDLLLLYSKASFYLNTLNKTLLALSYQDRSLAIFRDNPKLQTSSNARQIVANVGFMAQSCANNYLENSKCYEYGLRGYEIATQYLSESDLAYQLALYYYAESVLAYRTLPEALVLYKKLLQLQQQYRSNDPKSALITINFIAAKLAITGNYFQAEQYFLRANKLAQDSFGIKSIQYLSSQDQLIQFYSYAGLNDSANTVIDDLYKSALSLQGNDEESDQLRVLAYKLKLFSLRNPSEKPEAKTILNKILLLISKYPNDPIARLVGLQIKAYDMLALRSDLNKAQHYFAAMVHVINNAQKAHKAHKNSHEIERMKFAALDTLSMVIAATGNYPMAINTASSLYKLTRSKGRTMESLIPYRLQKLAEYHVGVGKLDIAGKLLDNALAEANKINSSADLSSFTYLAHGHLSALKGRESDTMEYFDKFTVNYIGSIYASLWHTPSYLRSRLSSPHPEEVDSIFQYPGISNLINRAALFARLNFHGLMADIEVNQNKLISKNKESSQLIERLQKSYKQISSATISSIEKRKTMTTIEELETELFQLMPFLRYTPTQINDVANKLPSGSVLIEFQKYGKFPRPDRTYLASHKKYQYVAFVLGSTGSINRFDLGSAEIIDAAIVRASQASSDGLSDASERWADVSKLIVAPLRKTIPIGGEIFVSPDSELNRVPFVALPSPFGLGVLADVVRVRVLTSGRDLLSLSSSLDFPSRTPIVIANPFFDGSISASASIEQSINRSSGPNTDPILRDVRWRPLPATEKEGSAIASLISARLVHSAQATPSFVQSSPSPRIIHIASHGYFVGDRQGDKLMSGTQSLVNSFRLSESSNSGQSFRSNHANPLLKSGIVLAGANQPPSSLDDDGYLTALEVSRLQLNGTELFVVSACESGKGNVQTGEGVYGLSRAITVAGARSSLLSLWKVDDAATAEFMIRFYKRLKAGEGRSDALAAVQKEFRAGSAGDGKWKEPYYWAAWQLVGDWRPIPGL